MDLTQIESNVLLEELSKRGFMVHHIWSLNDVELRLKYYNESNKTDVSLDEKQMRDILWNAVNDDYVVEEINNYITWRIQEIDKKI